MPTQLTITPRPFKSSNLAIPTSPFSPKLPITPPASPPKDSVRLTDRSKSRPKLELPQPPYDALNWLWQCHICNRVYQLGVTRRCLDDGHFFCAGTTTVKRSRRTGYKETIRHKACASEFDYQGWKSWGTWRRNVAEQMEAAEALQGFLNDETVAANAQIPPSEGRWLSDMWTKNPLTKTAIKDHWAKDCWNTCDYPSECRWGKQYGVQTPVATVTVPSSPVILTIVEEEEKSASTSFDNILLDVPGIADPDSPDYLEPLAPMNPTPPEEDTKKPSMDELLESAKRRKRRSAGQSPSPLASNPPSPTGSDLTPSTASVLQKAFDDFDLDIRKSFGRAGEAVTNFVGGVRYTGPTKDEKADASLARSEGSKKRSSSGPR